MTHEQIKDLIKAIAHKITNQPNLASVEAMGKEISKDLFSTGAFDTVAESNEMATALVSMGIKAAKGAC